MSPSGLYSHLQDLDDDEIPRYPPFAKGLPATPVDKLIATQRQLIARIHQSLGFSQDDAQKLLYPVVRNYAAFVHLLPASEGHHHRGAGGLFRHGLEVAFWATQASEATIFVPEGSPEEKLQKEPRWRFAVFLGALMHDLGKPLSDLVVTDKPGALEWNPYAETLEQWLTESGVTHYFLRWNKGRHQRHERLATLALNMVITPDVNRYLRPPGPELMKTLIEAISGTSAQHPMAKMIMAADAESVKRDLKESRLSVDGNSLGVSIEPYIIDAIRSLVLSGRWKTNQMDAQVWHLSQGTFIAWRQAVPSLVQKLKDNAVPAVPHDPDTLADYLIDRGFAVPRPIPGREEEADTNYYRYWEVTVSVEAEEGLIVEPRIMMLRMEDSYLVFGNATNPPDMLPARVPGLDDNGQLILQTASETTTDTAEHGQDEDEHQEETDDQAPESVRERLAKYKPREMESSSEFDALSSLLGGVGASSTPTPGQTAKEGSNDNKRNTDNTLKTQGEDALLTLLQDDTASLKGANPLELIAPPRRAKPEGKAKAPSAPPPSSSKQDSARPDVSAPDVDLSAMISPSGKNNRPSAAVTAKEPSKPRQTPPTTPSMGHKEAPAESLAQSNDISPSESDDVLDALSDFAKTMGEDLGMDLPFEVSADTTSQEEAAQEGDIQYETVEPEVHQKAPTSPPEAPAERPEAPSPKAPERIPALAPATGPAQSTRPAPALATGKDTSGPAQKLKKTRKRKKTAPPVPVQEVQPADVAGTTADIFQDVMPTAKRPKKTRGRTNASPASLVTPPQADHASKGQADDWRDGLTSAGKAHTSTAELTSKSTKPKPKPKPTNPLALDILPTTKRKAAAPDQQPPGKPDAPSAQPSRQPEVVSVPAPVATPPEASSGPAVAPESLTQQDTDAQPADDVARPPVADAPEPEVPANHSPGQEALKELSVEPAQHVEQEPSAELEPPAEPVRHVPDTHAPSEAPVPAATDEPNAPESPESMADAFWMEGDWEPFVATDFQALPPLAEPIATSEEAKPVSQADMEEIRQEADQYITDLLAPILKGQGLLGQVLMRQDAGQLVVLLPAAAVQLSVDQAHLKAVLSQAGVVLSPDADQVDDVWPLAPSTEKWVNKLLRDHEQARLKLLEEQDYGPKEQPSASLTRRKPRPLPPVEPETVAQEEPGIVAPSASPRAAPAMTGLSETEGKGAEGSDDAEDRETVLVPKASMSAIEALSLLRKMVLAGDGQWLVGSVTKETTGYSVSDLCLEKVVADNPKLTRRSLRNALTLSAHLNMNLVAEQKRLYVKE